MYEVNKLAGRANNTMSNKLKAIISIIVAALVQVAGQVFGVQIPEVVINSVTGLLVFVAGLFIKAPEEKKS